MPPESQSPGYESFWEGVGAQFPSLKGAASTQYYFECECTLCKRFFPEIRGRSILKSDLWDEAKNSEILLWLANNGARPLGIDISSSVVKEARYVLTAHNPGFAVADVRSLPFASNSFDFVYSMGTIEHFEDSGTAVSEMFRVLKPSGIAIIGVPNKLDPFLRPLLVHLWNRISRYPYGMEKSFSPKGLRKLLETAGFHALDWSGILFMPGWLRILDLWCHVHAPRLARLTGALVRPFAWAYRRFPPVRRLGYLIAWAAVKP